MLQGDKQGISSDGMMMVETHSVRECTKIVFSWMWRGILQHPLVPAYLNSPSF
jgi:hypothetical protein